MCIWCVFESIAKALAFAVVTFHGACIHIKKYLIYIKEYICTMDIKKRIAPANEAQKKLLIHFMKGHEELATGKFTNEFSQRKGQDLWEEVTLLLNSCVGGAQKDWKHWRRVSG